MTTYVYETVPTSPDEPVETFEIKQSMKDAPLSTHPVTGKPVRRIISGGLGIIGANSGKSSENCPDTGKPCCGGNHCSCNH